MTGGAVSSTRGDKDFTGLAAVLLLAIGYGCGCLVHVIWYRDKSPFIVASGVSVFAVFFVLSLAIERIVQPFSGGLGPDTSTAKAALVEAKTAASADVTQKRKAVENARDKTAVVTWGLASGLGFLLASVLNVTMLGTILAAGQEPWYWVDLLITGLVIGSGTKPLNDLVTRLQDKDVKA